MEIYAQGTIVMILCRYVCGGGLAATYAVGVEKWTRTTRVCGGDESKRREGSAEECQW